VLREDFDHGIDEFIDPAAIRPGGIPAPKNATSSGQQTQAKRSLSQVIENTQYQVQSAGIPPMRTHVFTHDNSSAKQIVKNLINLCAVNMSYMDYVSDDAIKEAYKYLGELS